MRLNIVHVLLIAAVVAAGVLVYKHRAKIVAAFSG